MVAIDTVAPDVQSTVKLPELSLTGVTAPGTVVTNPMKLGEVFSVTLPPKLADKLPYTVTPPIRLLPAGSDPTIVTVAFDPPPPEILEPSGLTTAMGDTS